MRAWSITIGCLILMACSGPGGRGGSPKRGANPDKAPADQPTAVPSTPPVVPGTPSTTTPAGALPPPTPAATVGKTTVRGTMTREGTSLKLIRCDTKAAVTVIDGTGSILAPLWGSLGEPLFILGVATPQVDGSLRLDALHTVLPGEGPGCSVPATWHWRASGTEPFWAVTLRGDQAVFEQPDEPRRIELTVRQATDGVKVWSSAPAPKGGHSITINLVPEGCFDGMSGAWSSHRAEVVLDGRKLQGCGAPGAGETSGLH